MRAAEVSFFPRSSCARSAAHTAGGKAREDSPMSRSVLRSSPTRRRTSAQGLVTRYPASTSQLNSECTMPMAWRWLVTDNAPLKGAQPGRQSSLHG